MISNKKQIIIVIFLFILITINILKIINNYKVIHYFQDTLHAKDIKIVKSRLIDYDSSFYNMTLEYPKDKNTINIIHVHTNFLGEVDRYRQTEKASDKMLKYIINNIKIISLKSECDVDIDKNDNKYIYDINYVAYIELPDEFFEYIKDKKDDRLRQIYYYIQLLDDDKHKIESEKYQLIENIIYNYQDKKDYSPVKLIAHTIIWTPSPNKKQHIIDAINNCEIEIYFKDIKRKIKFINGEEKS